MIRSDPSTIFLVSELDSSTIFNSTTFLLTESDLLDVTILVYKFCLRIALAMDDPIKPHPIMHPFLNITLKYSLQIL